MNYLKLDGGGAVTVQYLPEVKVTIPSNQNHILIFDRSGSMQGDIRSLVRDLQALLLNMGDGDCISVGWFSSESEYGWLCPPMLIDSRSTKVLTEHLEQNASTKSTTCFSRILETLPSVIASMQALTHNNAIHLALFTDGRPVVGDYDREVRKILHNLSEVAESVTTATFVAYGTSPDRDLMARMATATGGTLVNSSDLRYATGAIKRHVENSTMTAPRIEVVLDRTCTYVVTIDNGVVATHQVEAGNVAKLPASTEKVFYFGSEDFMSDSMVVSGMEVATDVGGLVTGSYALALSSYQRGQIEAALAILSTLGDIALYEAMYKAFTAEESASVEELLTAAVFNPKSRLLGGRKTGCLPPENVYSILDAVDMLVADDHAKIHYGHPSFRYSRIGKKDVYADNALHFTANKDGYSPFSEVVWHATRLNLSVRLKIEGTIGLDPDEAKKYGLPVKFATYQWRTYTLIKDGELNMKTLPVSMSRESFEILLQNGLIERTTYVPETPYLVDFSSTPMISRSAARHDRSLSLICNNMVWAKQVGASLYTYKKLLEELRPVVERSEKLSSMYAQETVVYLASIGVTDSGYSPDIVKTPYTDKYQAPSINVKSYGIGDLATAKYPALDSVSATSSSELAKYVYAALSKYNAVPLKSDEEKIAYLEREIVSCRKGLESLRRAIRRTMFSVILGKQNFVEFNSLKDTTLVIDDREFVVERSFEDIKI